MQIRHVRLTGVFALLVLASAVLVGCPPSGVVFIPDAGLEAAIRESIQKPFGLLTQTDLLGVIELDARNREIADLTGLEFCTNLEWADFSSNQLDDLSPLAQLSAVQAPLSYLNLENNSDITDIRPLAGLFYLEGLSLFQTDVADVGPVVDLAELALTRFGEPGHLVYLILDAERLLDDEDRIIGPKLNADVERLTELGVEVIFATELSN